MILLIALPALPAQGVGATPVRQTGQLIPDGLYQGDNFGLALALSADGNTALIGAAEHSGTSGVAYLYG